MANLLVLSETDIRDLLPVADCIPVMEEALSSLAGGEVEQPLRTLLRSPDAKGLLGLMPSYRGGAKRAFGLKAVCVFPGNPQIGLDTHLGGVLLYSSDTGELRAIMNASAITAIRTAAVTALATRLLARDDSRTLAIVGTGVQARTHLEALRTILPFDRIRVAGRTRETAERFVRDYSGIEVCDSVEQAVRSADVIVTVTNSREPILKREWIAPGAHLNLVGSSIATAREADSMTMAAGPIFVDRRESTINESGDFLMAKRDGLVDESHIRAEIGDILTGAREGRTSRDEITIFKSLGLAIEDLAAAQELYVRALKNDRGTLVPF